MNKITSFEASLIKDYVVLLKAKYPTLNNLENEIDKEKIDLFKASFLNTVNQYAEIASKERINEEKKQYDFDEEYEETMYQNYFSYNKELKLKEAVQGACVYALATQDECYYDFIHEILDTDIDTTVCKIKGNSPFADEALFLYYRYLKERITNPNFDDIMMFVYDDHDWLVRLENYKGFTTINDLLRDVLVEICFDHNTGEFITDKGTQELDLYFTSKKHDFYLQERFGTILDEKTIQAYKNYQLKLIMSDAYTFLKYASLKENEYPLYAEEEEILEDLESALLEQNFQAFTDFQKRRFVYNEFWVNANDDYINARRNPIRFLIENDEVKTLKMGNPIYFLE